MNPKISIIVPIYNVERYLKRCIDSILSQTFKDFELILVNDGSLDRCGEICDIYKNQDRRIRVIHKKNGGVSSARNQGIDISKGDYIYFIDSDDFIDKDAIAYLYDLSITHNSDITCYSVKTYKNETLKTKINYKEEIQVYDNEDIIREYVESDKFLYSTWNKLYKRKLFIHTRFSEDIRYAEDALINYYLLSSANRLIMSNLQKYNYCINKYGVVSNLTENRLDILKAQKEIYEFLNSNYKKYTKYISNQYINSSILIAIDIGIEGKVKEKRYILNQLKEIIKSDKHVWDNIEHENKKQKLLFNILRINPIIISKIYKLKSKL